MSTEERNQVHSYAAGAPCKACWRSGAQIWIATHPDHPQVGTCTDCRTGARVTSPPAVAPPKGPAGGQMALF